MQGRVRLLKYAKSSDSLFFTTDLQNSVQSYSLQESKLRKTSHDHPTPPSVFAISCNSQFLVSTSTAPPTIHLTDLSLNMLPILVRPQCSSSAVVAAAFHPERVSFFLLAFADGTAAVFDATHFFRKHDKKDHGKRPAVSGAGGVLAFMKGLHAQGTFPSKMNDVYINGTDPGTNVIGIGDNSWGITAIAFVPGRKATVVTAGADGKCCVVDFTQTTKGKALLLRTWHLRRPATSVSVICSPPALASGQLDLEIDPHHARPEESRISPSATAQTPNESYYIAVGRHDGRVLLFDLNGKSLGEQTLNESGAPIIDVEWTQVENHAVITRRNSSPATSRTSDAILEQRALGTFVLSRKRHVQEEAPLTPSMDDVQPRDSLFDFSTSTPRIQRLEYGLAKTSHLDETHPSFAASEGVTIRNDGPKSFRHAPTTPSNSRAHRTTVSNPAEIRSCDAPDQIPTNETTPPPVPPRPSPRPGGLLSMRRANTDYSYQVPADDSYLSLIANARNLRNNLSIKAKGSFGPRPMRSREGGSHLRSAMTSDDQSSSGQSEVAWSDVPPTPPPHGLQMQSKSATASVESFQTASSQVDQFSQSDRSTDTVVDWDVGPIRKPMPSLEEDSQSIHNIAHNTPKQKAHVSFSASSASHGSPTPPTAVLTNTSSPIVQWPPFSPEYSGLGLHASHLSHQSPAKAKSKQKGHICVSLSSASYDSSAPSTSSATGDLVVQWPSLKKSPRMPELNKAVSYSEQDTSIKSVRESATGFVLETYMGAPSPPKAAGVRSPMKESPEQDKHSVGSATAIEAALDVPLRAFRAEMVQRFDEQRLWLENLIKGDEEGKMVLVDENRRLKAEVANLKKELGQVFSE